MEITLKQIKSRLQKTLKKFVWKGESITQADQTMFSFTGLTNIREVITDIEGLGLFKNLTDVLKQSIIFTTAKDGMIVQRSEGAVIQTNLNQLKTLATNFQEILLNTVPDESIESINIKLPPINDFDELSKVSREIHISLTQVLLNDNINGQTKIVSVENGSIWLNVLVGTTAVTLVASLTWAAAVIYKKIQEGRLLEQQIRSLKVKNESLEDILKAQKAETALMIQAEAEHIQSEFFQNNPADNIERIKNSISTFADLISKGAEIHPALVAPESVSNLFPDPTKLIGLESKIKRLANPSDN